MSNISNIAKLSSKNIATEPNCFQWVSVAAYYKAEARNFEPGKEVEDWIAAETEYTQFIIRDFLICCEEDGGITTAELQELGRKLGIDHPDHLNTEIRLIREIQKISHHRPCFQSRIRADCEEDDCQWRSECQKLIAFWIQ